MWKINYKILSAVVLSFLLLPALSVAELKVGRPAPDFRLFDLAGNAVKLSDFKGKKHVIIDFWAIWCGPCRMAMPVLHKAADRYAEADVKVISLNLREDKKKVAKFIEDSGYESFLVVLDKTGKVGDQYRVRGIPHLAFIDKQGNYQGHRTATEFMTVGAYASPMKEYFRVEDPLKPVTKLYDSSRPLTTGEVLADFRQGLGEWNPVSDKIMKGKSTVTERAAADGVELVLDLVKSRKWKSPFGGVNWFVDVPRDVSAYKKLVIVVARRWTAEPKGSRAILEVAFGGGKDSRELPMGMVELSLNENLSAIEIDFSAFEIPAWAASKFKTDVVDWRKFRGVELFVLAEGSSAAGSLELVEIRLVK
jgi:thiol-disulfide isomerase/thioredoxin